MPIAAATWLLERPLARVYRGVPSRPFRGARPTTSVREGSRPAEIEVIPNGVDLDFYRPDPGEPRFPDRRSSISAGSNGTSVWT